MNSEYIEQRNGGYYVAGTRISLDSVVYAFNRGESPEQILEGYPLLGSLARAYGAIAFYLNHTDEVEQVLEERRREEDAYIAAHPTPPDIKEKFDRMRRQMLSRRS